MICKIFYNDIYFASNDFIPETVRNNNTFYIQNMFKESEYFCYYLNLKSYRLNSFLLAFEHEAILHTYLDGDLKGKNCHHKKVCVAYGGGDDY